MEDLGNQQVDFLKELILTMLHTIGKHVLKLLGKPKIATTSWVKMVNLYSKQMNI